jgi:ABC-2 type transport system permease protein
MKLHRIKALFLRHLYPLKRDFDLLSDMIYWPLIDVVLWGITGQWLSGESGGGRSFLISILTGLVLWNIIWRAQAEVSRNLMDEIWNNNLINLFSTPLTVSEWVTSVLSLSVLKTFFTILMLIPVVFFLYAVNVFALGWWLILFFLSATITGWWVGFISAGIVLRHGPKVQTVIWTLPGILLPFSAVYFPVDKLPAFLQLISLMIPTTHIFETMRAVIQSQPISVENLVFSFVMNITILALTMWYFAKSHAYSKNLGLGRFN